MTKTSVPILFFGNERLSSGFVTTAPTLTRLIAAGYDVRAVIANYEGGKSRSMRELEVAAVAAAHNIPVIINEKPGAITDTLRTYQAVAGVLVAYGQIVPQRVIDLFPAGIVNIHPSLLPLHRGPTPIESVILNGDKQTGVSLMQLSKAMDAGPIYAQHTIPLTGNETKTALTTALLDAGSNMLIKHLPAILSGDLQPTPQDNTQATYDQLIAKNDGILDWTKHAVRLEREIRAYAEWPKSRALFNKVEVVITRAHVIAETGTPGNCTVINKQFVVYCGEQALVIDAIKPAGKKEMTGDSFLAGYKAHLNIV